MAKLERYLSRVASVLKAFVPLLDAAEIVLVRILCFGALVYELARVLVLRP